MTTHDESLPVNFARAMPNWQPLVEYRRNDIAENTIHGAVSWVSGRNVIYSFGGNVEVYGRSMVTGYARLDGWPAHPATLRAQRLA